jgi:hypothetical protein
VDVWDGFVDEAGKFTPQGPDYRGQIRRLRTSDGVHFTKFGARKLALYVEREIERSLSRTPVALPVPPDQKTRIGKDKPRAPARPEAGPVVPLTGANVGRREELLDGAREQPAIIDPVANRVQSRVKVFQQGERTISGGRGAPLIPSRMRRQRLLRNRLIVDRRSVRSKSVIAAGLQGRSQAHIEELPRMLRLLR